MRDRPTRFTLIFFLTLGALEYLLYFRPPGHFFQGDTIFLFYHRHKSISDFLTSFITLDPSSWYRPLTHRTIQSLFFPVFGLEPAGYRVIHFILFFAAIVATYKLASTIFERRVAACVATFFFTIHTVNAYITYDVTLSAELIYATLYVFAVTAYLRRNLRLSLICFAASLCSKESAVTLPATLFVLEIILNGKSIRDAITGMRAHLAVAVVYVAFVVGYLGVQHSAFQSILKMPGPEFAYRFALDRTIVTNADHALTWAFNLPRGWHTQWRGLAGWMIVFLKGFRAAVILISAWLLFRPERKYVLAGMAWFIITVSPALPLFEHFIPYYLFLPVVGFSIVIGIAFDAAFRRIANYSRPVASVAVGVPLAVLLVICAVSVRHDQNGNRILGLSSRDAENSLTDLRKSHPTLAPNTTIYITDAEEPDLSWDLAQAGLFQMHFNDESIQAEYWSWGAVITKAMMDRGPLIVMKYHQFHLSDVTRPFLAASATPVDYAVNDKHRLSVSPAKLTTGQSYRLSISGVANADVTIHYTLNGDPVQSFATYLDDNHEASFNVSPQTEKGLYRFAGFRLPSGEWIRADSTVQVY